MKLLMRRVILLFLLSLAPGLTFSQTKADGNWLMNGLAASERIKTRVSTDIANDSGDALALMGFVNGYVAAHKQNNLLFAVLVSASESMPQAQRREMVKTASLFVPLLRLPDGATSDQLMAVTKKYLEANPSKWHEPANILLVNALTEAFPSR